MKNAIATNLILLLVIFLPIAVAISALLIRRVWDGRSMRRSPLTGKVFNQAGDGIRKAMEKHQDRFGEATAMVIALGPVFLAAWLTARVSRVVTDWSEFRYGWGDALLLLVAASMLAWATARMVSSARQVARYTDGLAAELAVAQSLTRLVGQDAFVFHDFPADKFNIDHIVVGRSAVFAVETKSRRKPSATGKASARVKYDGSRLTFPDHIETKPVEQAAYQAKWLQTFLASGVGEPVRVVPVLSLPGWYVDGASKRPDVLVTNCHNPNFMTSSAFGPPLSDEMRRRIAHVLAERYPGLPDA